MDAPDRPDAAPLAPLAPAAAYLPKAAWEPEFAAEPPPRPKLSPRVAWRALRRHWWQALALWAVASVGLATLAYYKIKPRYPAQVWIDADTASKALLAQGTVRGGDSRTALETHVQLLTSPDVLNEARLDEALAALPRIRTALDPEAELRKEIKAAILPGTKLILVEMASEVPGEAAAIVNGVVRAYLKSADAWTQRETNVKIARLKELETAFKTQQEGLRTALRDLNNKSVSEQIALDKGERVSLDAYKNFKGQISALKIAIIEAESNLRVLKGSHRPPTARRARAVAGPPRGEALDREVDRIFHADPEVAQVARDLKEAGDRLNEVKRLVRNPKGDPVGARWLKRQDELRQRYAELRAAKVPGLRAQLAQGLPVGDPAADVPDDPRADEVEDATLQVAKLRDREEKLKEQLDALIVEAKHEGLDALDVQFTRADLANTDAMLEQVRRTIRQLEQESSGGNQIDVVSWAKATSQPQNDRRTVIMATIPVGMFALVLGLFLVVEIRSGRVADPDDLPARVRVGVLGVVPPLPGPSAGRGLRAVRDEKRRVEEFVQSLDHLRVVLCSGAAGQPGRRCVLITSACGGEGKTTLAAQLAGRCANAGLTTVLVDADLRRPSLGELLEVPEGPGLADVLLGEAEPESAMVVIGNAGGFHLLPAGAGGHDPARLLQGDRLGRLVAQLRATFDVVIIDAPPVLSVPDALLLGRWTDGAVLAVRHDTSRFPLVERANRRLAAVGVPVLGAVVNGVRSMEAGYGVYHYAAHGRDDEALG